MTVAFGAALWNSPFFSIKDYLFPHHFETVLPGALFRSGQISPHLIERVLVEHGIRVVVDLTQIVPDSAAQSAERGAVERLGLEYHRFPLLGDGTGEIDRYVDAVATIARAQNSSEPVLVHCAAGDKRCGGVLAAYLLLIKEATADEAMDELGRCSKGHIASSTVVGFLNAHLEEIAAGLVRKGVGVATSRPLPRLVGGG